MLFIGISAIGRGAFLFRLCTIRSLSAAFGAGCAVCIGLAGLGRLGTLLICLGGRLVRLASVVGLIEARSLEDYGRPGAEDSPQFLLLAFGAFLQRRIIDRLKLVEIVVASVALILVGWHGFRFSLVKRLYSETNFVHSAVETATRAGRRTRS